MFRRTTNFDLLNKIQDLDNKIDIIYTKIYDNDITFTGCCDCKVKELIIYKEIKEYFEDKFNDILTKFENIEKQDKLNSFLQNYKNEILTNFETIISKLEVIKTTTETTNDNETYIYKLVENYDKITNQLNCISNKLDILYFENEIIKHQLSLEEDIRKYEQEINNMSNIINNTIDNINTTFFKEHLQN
jgi:uncharacterized protein (DUF885 family)